MHNNTKIYLLNINDSYPINIKFLNMLNHFELEKYKKFLHKNDAINYLYSHSILKILLSNIKKCHYKNLNFFTNKYGKPYVKNGPFFSISHTIGMIAIAISNVEIGLDIENINRNVNWQNLDLIWSKSEKNYLHKINYNYNNQTFYKIWTLKESILKAIGTGLNLPLENIVLPLKSINYKNKILAMVKQNIKIKIIHCYNIKLPQYSSSIAGNNIKNISIENIEIKDYL